MLVCNIEIRRRTRRWKHSLYFQSHMVYNALVNLAQEVRFAFPTVVSVVFIYSNLC